jgi:sugar-phosphatase
MSLGPALAGFAAVLSDLDGVLVDSGDTVEAVWRAWAREHDVDPDWIVEISHGVPSGQVIARVLPGIAPDRLAHEAARVEAMNAATNAPAFPGARELLGGVPAGRLAIVTSSGAQLAPSRLRGAGLPTPSVLVPSERVERGKPAPDPYLLAARELGVDPARCVVLEDAPAGIEAGREAGATVWAVATTHDPAELTAADRIAPDLATLVADLLAPEAEAAARAADG